MIASWTSAFMVPLAVVISVQLARLEKGAPVWSIAQLAGGILMSLFLVLRPCSGASRRSILPVRPRSRL